MIDEIRSYFKTVIESVDGDLKQHPEYFTAANVSDNVLEDTYFLQMGELVTQRTNTDMIGTLNVTVIIWKNGYTDTVSNLDDAYCKAIEIQLKAMHQGNFNQLGFIKAVNGTSIVPQAVENNDNLGAFELQFIVTTGMQPLKL